MTWLGPVPGLLFVLAEDLGQNLLNRAFGLHESLTVHAVEFHACGAHENDDVAGNRGEIVVAAKLAKEPHRLGARGSAIWRTVSQKPARQSACFRSDSMSGNLSA